jgi:hypothetical protein
MYSNLAEKNKYDSLKLLNLYLYKFKRNVVPHSKIYSIHGRIFKSFKDEN